jgi:hypothetical protein
MRSDQSAQQSETLVTGKSAGKAAWPADHVERWPTERLIPLARNARTHSDVQVSQIASSIREWGWTNPVLVAEDGTIIAGHGRVLAARKLRLTDVPVMIASEWTDAQKRAYAIADNKLTLNGGWDEELLGLEIGELEVLGFDLDLIGFTDAERAALAAQLTEGLTDPDVVPDLPSEPVTRAGDLWVLGRHRLLCGDSTSQEDVNTLLAGVSPHLMVTDPPYGVNYDPAWRKRAGVNLNARKLGKVANDDRADWREAWALFPGSVAYVWHAVGIQARSSNPLRPPALTCALKSSGPRTVLPSAGDTIIGSTSPAGMRCGARLGRTGAGTASNQRFGPSTRGMTTGMATGLRNRSSVCAGRLKTTRRPGRPSSTPSADRARPSSQQK